MKSIILKKIRRAAEAETGDLFARKPKSVHCTRYELYTDGSCWPNPGGVGGWAAIILHDSREINRVTGSEARSTNNRAELLAIINGLRLIPEGSACTIYSDSQYCVNGARDWTKAWARRGWVRSICGVKTQIPNADLWKELCTLRDKRHCEFKWVRGHADCYWNNECDRLANEVSGVDRPF